MMMNKFSEMVTRSLQIAATLTSGQSSTALLDMSPYKKAMFQVVASKPIDATTFVGNITVTVYESTASTWNGAVATAMTSFTGTAACTSGASGNKFFEVNDYDMSVNNSKRYLGLYVSAWTNTDMVAIVERYRGDHEPLE
jgi:hypothetical protein